MLLAALDQRKDISRRKVELVVFVFVHAIMESESQKLEHRLPIIRPEQKSVEARREREREKVGTIFLSGAQRETGKRYAKDSRYNRLLNEQTISNYKLFFSINIR